MALVVNKKDASGEKNNNIDPKLLLLVKYLAKEKIIEKKIYKQDSIFDNLFYFKLKIEIKSFFGLGSSFDISTALSKAIGESIERYISGCGDQNKDILKISYKEAEKDYKSIYFPPVYHRYFRCGKKENQEISKRNLELLKEKKFTWVKGKNIITGEAALLPRQLTSWMLKSTDRDMQSEYLLCSSTSNGSAGYFDIETSTANSILEVIERDSFLVHWLTQLSPDILDIKSLPDYLQNKIKIIQDKKIRVFVLDTTTNTNIPSICIVLISDYDDIPSVALSASSDVSFYKAISDATDEAYRSCEFLKYKSDKILDEDNFVPFTNNVDQEMRMTIWRGDKWLGRFQFFISGKVVSYQDIIKKDLQINTQNESESENKNESREMSSLSVIEKELAKLGDAYYPIIYTPNNKLLKKINFVVTQAFIPACFPLYLRENLGTFDSDRLQDFYKYKKMKASDESIDVLEYKCIVNPWPHPFS